MPKVSEELLQSTSTALQSVQDMTLGTVEEGGRLIAAGVDDVYQGACYLKDMAAHGVNLAFDMPELFGDASASAKVLAADEALVADEAASDAGGLLFKRGPSCEFALFDGFGVTAEEHERVMRSLKGERQARSRAVFDLFDRRLFFGADEDDEPETAVTNRRAHPLAGLNAAAAAAIQDEPSHVLATESKEQASRSSNAQASEQDEMALQRRELSEWEQQEVEKRVAKMEHNLREQLEKENREILEREAAELRKRRQPEDSDNGGKESREHPGVRQSNLAGAASKRKKQLRRVSFLEEVEKVPYNTEDAASVRQLPAVREKPLLAGDAKGSVTAHGTDLLDQEPLKADSASAVSPVAAEAPVAAEVSAAEDSASAGNGDRVVYSVESDPGVASDSVPVIPVDGKQPVDTAAHETVAMMSNESSRSAVEGGLASDETSAEQSLRKETGRPKRASGEKSSFVFGWSAADFNPFEDEKDRAERQRKAQEEQEAAAAEAERLRIQEAEEKARKEAEERAAVDKAAQSEDNNWMSHITLKNKLYQADAKIRALGLETAGYELWTRCNMEKKKMMENFNIELETKLEKEVERTESIGEHSLMHGSESFASSVQGLAHALDVTGDIDADALYENFLSKDHYQIEKLKKMNKDTGEKVKKILATMTETDEEDEKLDLEARVNLMANLTELRHELDYDVKHAKKVGGQGSLSDDSGAEPPNGEGPKNDRNPGDAKRMIVKEMMSQMTDLDTQLDKYGAESAEHILKNIEKHAERIEFAPEEVLDVDKDAEQDLPKRRVGDVCEDPSMIHSVGMRTKLRCLMKKMFKEQMNTTHADPIKYFVDQVSNRFLSDVVEQKTKCLSERISLDDEGKMSGHIDEKTGFISSELEEVLLSDVSDVARAYLYIDSLGAIQSGTVPGTNKDDSAQQLALYVQQQQQQKLASYVNTVQKVLVGGLTDHVSDALPSRFHHKLHGGPQEECRPLSAAPKDDEWFTEPPEERRWKTEAMRHLQSITFDQANIRSLEKTKSGFSESLEWFHLQSDIGNVLQAIIKEHGGSLPSGGDMIAPSDLITQLHLRDCTCGELFEKDPQSGDMQPKTPVKCKQIKKERVMNIAPEKESDPTIPSSKEMGEYLNAQWNTWATDSSKSPPQKASDIVTEVQDAVAVILSSVNPVRRCQKV